MLPVIGWSSDNVREKNGGEKKARKKRNIVRKRDDEEGVLGKFEVGKEREV